MFYALAEQIDREMSAAFRRIPVAVPTFSVHATGVGHKKFRALPTGAFDTVLFTVLNIVTIGGLCAVISVAVGVVFRLELTPLDASGLVRLILALCASTFVLFTAQFLTCCRLKYGRLALAVLYTLFDLFILLCAIATLALRSAILDELGRIWTDDGQSSIVLLLEERLDCCGFNQNPNHDCAGRTQSCYTAIDQRLAQHSGAIGGSLVGFFLIFLVGVVLSYIRAFSNQQGAAAGARSHEMVQIQEKLTREETVWF
jgi:hypothetical protein